MRGKVEGACTILDDANDDDENQFNFVNLIFRLTNNVFCISLNL